MINEERQLLVAEVFNGSTQSSISFPLSQGICGHVATTGVTVNLVDAYSHPLFNPAVDIETNYKTTSLLCVPVKDSDGKVIGVVNMINKTDQEVEAFDELFYSYF